jgi:glycosyl transferase, family 25
MIPIFVISLKRATDRRRHIQNEFKKHQLVFEWYDAIDAQTISDAELSALIDHDAVKKHPIWLTKGALCCALSHYSVYQLVIERNLPYALVLEDDVILKKGFIGALEQAVLQLKENEVILLYNHNSQPLRLSSLETTLVANSRLYAPINVDGLGTTAAYLISRAACISMLKVILPIRCAADSWNVFYRNNGYQHIRYMYPEIVDTMDYKSTIEYIGNKKISNILGFIDKYKVFPFSQILKLRRYYKRQQMKQISVLPMPAFQVEPKALGE